MKTFATGPIEAAPRGETRTQLKIALARILFGGNAGIAFIFVSTGDLSKVLCKWILPIISFLVFEVIKIGVAGRAGQILASHANEGAGEAGKPGRGGFVRQNAGVKLLWEPLPVAASFYAIGKV